MGFHKNVRAMITPRNNPSAPFYLKSEVELFERTFHLVGKCIHTLTLLEGYNYIRSSLLRWYFVHYLHHVKLIRKLLNYLIKDCLENKVLKNKINVCLPTAKPLTT